MHKTAKARLPRQTHFWQLLDLQYLALPLLWVFLSIIHNAFYVHILKEGKYRKEMPSVLAFQM